jgi:cytidyltransferase-like protein/putative nucleotidyltransferase with HDIG domain
MKKIVWANKSNGQLCITIPKNSGIKEGDIVSIEKEKIKKIVYSVVTADLFHYGHLRLLQTANELGDFHICGVLTDEAIAAYKNEPIAGLKEREAIVSSLRCVDTVMTQRNVDPTENLKKVHADFPESRIILVFGSNWKKVPGAEYVKKIKGEIVQPPFYDKLSTEKVVEKIFKTYEGHSKSNNMTLIEFADACTILEEIAKKQIENKDILRHFLNHSLETAHISKEIAGKIQLNTKESALAGLFHDIGRCFTEDRKDCTFHEIVGANYLEVMGVELGICSYKNECERLAQSIQSHFVVAEEFHMPEFSKWLGPVRKTDPSYLLPHSWNEIVIIYADLSNTNGNRIGFQERIYALKDRYKQENNPKLKAINKAESRLFNLKTDLEKAIQTGKIDLTKYALL